jgi:hypothetical protein
MMRQKTHVARTAEMKIHTEYQIETCMKESITDTYE